MAGIFDQEAMKTCIASGAINPNRFVNLHGTASNNTALKTTVIAADGVTRPFGIFAPDERSAITTGDQARVLFGAQVTMLEVDGSGTAIATGDLLWSNAIGRGVVSGVAVDNTLAASAMALAPATTAGALIPVLLLNSPGATVTQSATITGAATGTTTLTAANFGNGNLVLLMPNTAAKTVALPAAADVPPGATLLIKKTTSDVALVTVDPDGTETISGHATVVNILNENDWLLIKAVGDGDHEWEVLGASNFVKTMAATGNQSVLAAELVGGHGFYLVPNTAALEIGLPAIAGVTRGTFVTIVKTSADAEIVTINPNGSEEIDGSATSLTNVDANEDRHTFMALNAGGDAWTVIKSKIA